MLRKSIYLVTHPCVLLGVGVWFLYLVWAGVDQQGDDFLVAVLPEFASVGILCFLAWLRSTVQLQRAVQHARHETDLKSQSIQPLEASSTLGDSDELSEVDRQSDVDWLLERGLISKRQALLWPQLENDARIQKALESVERAT